MKKSLLLVSALLATAALADEPRRIKLDGSGDATAPAAEPGKDGIDRIHKVEQPQMILFPAKKQPANGTVMVCPGGGYGILAVNHEGTEIAKMLNGAGWDVGVLLYRVSEGNETRARALEDAKAGLALIQKRGPEFGLSNKKVGVMGFSAGGHLSARVTHEALAAGTPPDFTVLMYPAYLEKDGVCLDDVAPTKLPTFVYVAANDSWAKSSDAYDKAAKEKNLPVTYIKAASGGHGFGLKPNLPPEVRDWPARLVNFLDGVLGKAPSARGLN
jgi:acetyl esterase/lipase